MYLLHHFLRNQTNYLRDAVGVVPYIVKLIASANYDLSSKKRQKYPLHLAVRGDFSFNHGFFFRKSLFEEILEEFADLLEEVCNLLEECNKSVGNYLIIIYDVTGILVKEITE